MAAARFTITANLVDLIGPGADWRKAVAVVTTNLGAGAGVAGAGGELGLGDGRVTVAQDGSLSASVVDPNDASLNVTGFAYTLHVSVPVAASMVRGRGAVRQTYSFGPFVPDASGPITTWRNQFDTPAVDPVWRDGFRAEMEDIRDEAAAIVDGLVPLRIRSDVASPYAYIGTAPVGTADADTGWLVSRIHLTAHETQTATGAWDDRAVLPYES